MGFGISIECQIQKKVRTKFLENFIFGHFRPILHILVNFFGKLGCQLLDFTIIYHNAENQEKLMNGY